MPDFNTLPSFVRSCSGGLYKFHDFDRQPVGEGVSTCQRCGIVITITADTISTAYPDKGGHG